MKKIKRGRVLLRTMSTMASEFHSIHPALALPQRSLWHHQHPTETDTEKVVHTLKHTSNTPLHTRGKLTHFISSSVKRRPVINMRRGMVRMSMKGRARDIGLDLTIHKIARHTSWMAVNKCIRPVLTCRKTCTNIHSSEWIHRFGFRGLNNM